MGNAHYTYIYSERYPHAAGCPFGAPYGRSPFRLTRLYDRFGMSRFLSFIAIVI